MCLRLLSARHTSFLSLLCGCRAPEYTDTVSFKSRSQTLCDHWTFPRVARNRWLSHYVTSAVPVSRATGPLTCMFPVSVSRDFYDMCMSHGGPPRLPLCRAYIFSLMPLTRLSWTSLRPLVSRTICSPVLVMPSLLPGSLSLVSLTRLDGILVSYFYSFYTCLYLYLSYLYIYWVGDGTIPIFNLLCNHPSVVT